jgi:peptidoglycan hydrolase-like protein with peptidoglycan-binding domain
VPEPERPHAGELPTLAVGATGKSVHLLQALLIQHGILQDSDGNRDGVLGPPTARKVSEFQARRGLSQTGQVDPATWRALLDAGFVHSLPELARGATGNEVFVLQCILILRRVIQDSDDNRDRSFGPGIEGKVQSFQTQNGLRASGRVDRATWVALAAF